MNEFNKVILLKGMQIYAEDQQIKIGYMVLENQKIIDYGPIENIPSLEGCQEIEIPESFKAVPGFIDVHIHGVDGADVMDATYDALERMTEALPREGTTSFLATTITQASSAIETAIENVGKFICEKQVAGKAEILGIHLEGPFVNKARAGAQPEAYIVHPDIEKFKRWNTLAQQTIKLVTLAPELPGGLELARYFKENKIIASIGHSDATYEQVVEAIEAGVNHVTHLYNQMRPLHHRDPGVVGAAFLHDELKAEMIVDGIHSRPEMVKLAYQQKGSEGIILITDSMRAKCLKNGVYDLGGQAVTVADGKALLENGSLAGSILKLGHGVKNIMEYTGCPLDEAIQMASMNPAKQLGIFDKKGSILNGKDADIVILDENNEVTMTFCRGKQSFQKGER